MLLGLILCTDWIIFVRRRALLNVRSQNMRHNFSASKRNQSRCASRKLRKIAHVQTPWIQTVACEKNTCLAIVERDAQCIVSRNWYDVENALAKIDVSNAFRPFIDTEKLAGAI